MAIWGELRQQRLVQTGASPREYEGYRTFVCRNSYAMALMSTLDVGSGRWPAISGSTSPICDRVERVDHSKNWSMVTAHYKTARPTGYARIITQSAGIQRKLMIDLDGKKVTGPDWSDTFGAIHWDICAGENVIPLPITKVIVQTALAAGNYWPLMFAGFVNKTNANHVSLLGANPGTLWAFEPQTEFVFGNKFVNIDFVFLYNPTGWATYLKRIPGAVYPVKVPVRDEDGAATGEYAKQLVYSPLREFKDNLVRTAAAEACRFLDPIDFSFLNGLQAWRES